MFEYVIVTSPVGLLAGSQVRHGNDTCVCIRHAMHIVYYNKHKYAIFISPVGLLAGSHVRHCSMKDLASDGRRG